MSRRSRPVTFVNVEALLGVMSAQGVAIPVEMFAPRLPEIEPGPLVAQGRLVDAIADGSVLRGTAHELAARLGVPVGDLMAALDELLAVGWLALESSGDGIISVRWMEQVGEGSRARAG